MKSAKILLILFVVLFSINIRGAEDIHSIYSEGKENWKGIESFIIEKRYIWTPPSTMYEFVGKYIYVNANAGAIGENIKKVGEWKISQKDGFIGIKFYDENKEEKFYSYKIREVQQSIQILLYIGKKFKEPKDENELLSSMDYLVLFVRKGQK